MDGASGESADASTAPQQPAALIRVRDDLARLGTDVDSAPEVPAEVVDRVAAALRDVAARRRLRRVATAVGSAAVVLAGIVGVMALVRSPAPTRSAGLTAERITVSARAFPMSRPQLIGLLTRNPDYGALTDPQRLASCLAGLGQSPGAVLGATPIEVAGRANVLLLLPGDTPETLAALVVGPNCGSADTGLLAETTLALP